MATAEATKGIEYNVHPVAAIFPMMSDEEIAALAEDIKERGLVDPIILHEGVLVDGRNRLAACNLIGCMPRVEKWKPSKGAQTIESWIVSKNLHRRHLTTSQRADLVPQLVAAGVFPNLESGAKAMQVSTQTAYSAKAVRDKGSAALKDAVGAGEVSVSAAAEVADLPKSEQTALVKRGPRAVREKAKSVRATKAASPKTPKGRKDAGPAKDQSAQFQRDHGKIVKAVHALTNALMSARLIAVGEVDHGHADTLARLGMATLGRKGDMFASTCLLAAEAVEALGKATRKVHGKK